ncbi:MAG: adenylate/guanylate cyclase domain-containing protein [Sandaracinaceae bacterium]|nr:adenylate/guanylate cyclase domain-containing protein [Sandaracinaceae bacterium]
MNDRLTVSSVTGRRSGVSWEAAMADREKARVSIVFKLIASTALLVAVVLVSCVTLWIQSETRSMRRLKRQEARAFAVAMSGAWSNELIDENWNQIRNQLRTVVTRSPDYVYVLLSDERRGGRIVAAVPDEYVGHHVPDLVRASDTEHQLVASEEERLAEVVLLRDVEWPQGHVRAHRGDEVVEVASDMTFEGRRIGVLRVGISLRRIEGARDEIVKNAVVGGLVVLLLGMLGAWLVARRITGPVLALEESAARMAAGDLAHRSPVASSDEIGSLSRAFNRMADVLERSFARLRGTVAAFERFVPRKFLAVIAPQGIENIQVGARQERVMTILFCDIRGYTSLSEASTAEQMFDLLNDYLAEMGTAIEENGGFIDKYIGDAIMALFDDVHTDRAIDAALAMRMRLLEFNLRRAEKGLRPVDVGIGIHRGSCIMGTVGFSSRIDSTVIGDAVNLASRVEGLTKQYHADVLVTGAVVEGLEHRDRYALRLVDEAARAKGKDLTFRLYAVDDRTSVLPEGLTPFASMDGPPPR